MVDNSDVVHISLSDVEIAMISVERDLIVYDSGASISIFNDYGGHEKLVLPKKFLMTGNGRIETSSGFMHPLFGLVYVYEELPVNIVSAYEISHNPRYQVVPYPDDTRDVYDANGTVFFVRWNKKTLMINMEDTWNPTESERVYVGMDGDDTYEDLLFVEDEIDAPLGDVMLLSRAHHRAKPRNAVVQMEWRDWRRRWRRGRWAGWW